MSWWHQRYVLQTGWTKVLRFHLYRRLEIARSGNILEIGCGTGVIAGELAGRTNSAIYGLDVDLAALLFAREQASNKGPIWVTGNAEKLPFGDESLDLIVAHYFWLWAGRPEVVIDECRRVLKKGGTLAALTEPDYAARQNLPDGHPSIKEFLMNDLAKKGANPDIGKKLEDIFTRAGFKTIMGSLSDKVTYEENPELFQQEWELLERLEYPAEELASIKKDPEAKWMIMPVHWAIGRKM